MDITTHGVAPTMINPAAIVTVVGAHGTLTAAMENNLAVPPNGHLIGQARGEQQEVAARTAAITRCQATAQVTNPAVVNQTVNQVANQASKEVAVVLGMVYKQQIV